MTGGSWVWERVRLGDRIRDPDGDVWTVTAVADGRFHVMRGDLLMWMYDVDDELVEP